MPNNPTAITIVHFNELGGLLESSNGYGVFVPCAFGQMNVGAILPCPDGRYLLNIMISKEMEIFAYETCEFSEEYETFDAAADAARKFLASKRKPEQ